MSYQGADSKKEEFRKYLERAGVIDTLTKALVGLYEQPEKPTNAIDYLKGSLGAPGVSDADSMREENEALKRQNAELSQKVAALEQKVAELSGSS